MVGLTLWCLLLLCLWPSAVWTQADVSFRATYEEGTKGQPWCYATYTFDFIGWQLKVNNEYVNISACDFQGNCTDYMAPDYTSEFFIDEVDGVSQYTIEMTIWSIDKEESTFRCFIGTKLRPDFPIEVYARPSEPVCDPPVVVNSDTQLSITCRTDKVYPGALMEAKMHKADSTDGPEAAIECKTSPSMTYSGYNSTQCTALFPLSGLQLSSYEIQAAMYPNVTNTTVGLGKKVESDQIDPIKLTAPGVQLARNCPINVYIVSGMCKCELTIQGYPPGQARWYTQTGQVVGTENNEDKSSTLILEYSSKDLTPSYECRADTVLDQPSVAKVSYVPMFATGPSSVTLETSGNSQFDLCPSEKHTTTLTCRVPQLDVEPGVKLTITVDSVPVVDQQPGKSIGSDYVQDYIFRPSKGGSYFVTCKAENTISATLSLSKSAALEVREPPKSSPVFLVPRNEPGSKVAKMVLGETVDITCRVDGGHPQVSEVTIICGSRRQKVEGYIVALTVEVASTIEGLICYCSATHASGCYDKVSNVSLKVQEVSEEDEGQDLDQMLIIVLPVIAAVVVIALFVLIVVLYLRKRRSPASRDKDNNYASNHPSPPNPWQGDYLAQRPPDYSANNYITVTDHYDAITNYNGSIRTDEGGYSNPYSTAERDYDKIIYNDPTKTSGDGSYSNPSLASPEYDRISDVSTSAGHN